MIRAYLDVLEEILKYIVVEGAVFADEALTVTPDFHKKALDLLPQGASGGIYSHTELKERSKDAKAIVLTGEFTGYTNDDFIGGDALTDACSHKGHVQELLAAREGNMEEKLVLQMDSIVKTFPGVKALDPESIWM